MDAGDRFGMRKDATRNSSPLLAIAGFSVYFSGRPQYLRITVDG
jgi:hypothetical protein